MSNTPAAQVDTQRNKTNTATANDHLDDSYYVASSWQLMGRKFRKHKLAMIGMWALVILYVVGAVAPGFFSTTDIAKRHRDHVFARPQRVRIFHEGRLRRPFVYGTIIERDSHTFRRIYIDDSETIYPIHFF